MTATVSSLAFKTAAELLALFQEGEASPVEATRAILERIEQLNPALNAYLHVDSDGALRVSASARSIVASRRTSAASRLESALLTAAASISLPKIVGVPPTVRTRSRAVCLSRCHAGPSYHASF